MRFFNFITVVALFALVIAGSAQADTEQEMVDRFLKTTAEKHTAKLGWASFHFNLDRMNRHNDYNDFATLESAKLSNGEFDWVRQGYSFGADFGIVFNKRFAWSLGGEYWLKMGETLPTGDTYLQLSTGTAVNSDPRSEMSLYGVTTGFHYFLLNPPTPAAQLDGLSARLGGSVGYYTVNWDLWQEYENLNLSTAAPTQSNTTYHGTAPGFSFGLGMDYPLNIWNLGLGMDLSYLYLNFDNVAWYNEAGEEIVASLDGTEENRIDLSFSGIRGKIELKRYFSW